MHAVAAACQDLYAQNSDLGANNYSKKITQCQYVVEKGEMICMNPKRSASSTRCHAPTYTCVLGYVSAKQ